ncbi:MAG: hypothetical protein HGA44_08050, partial [Cellulomonadaceae bacterium]|nr:hypothetical protein [Cellulomonadaceae bacterium]
FASTLTAPQSSLVPVPHGLAPDVAVLAEPLAVALCALDAVPAPPARVLVLGYGPVGALVHAAVGQRWPEARVRVLETEPGRAALAERLGSLPDDDDAHDLVVDAAAFPGSVALAVARVRRGGTVVLVGLGSAPIGVSTQALVEKGVTLHGSIGFDDAHLPAALAMLAAAPARFAGLVSDRVPLSGLAEFLARSGPRPVGKVVVDCAS